VPGATPRPAPRAEVEVVVSVNDRPDQLARCLSGLGTEHPVVVVNDGRRDQARSPPIMARGEYGWPGSAGRLPHATWGSTWQSPPFVALVDSDVVVDHGSLE
jgi:mycofactocin glycosyltransferase